MNLLICMITYNRLYMTRKTLKSLKETITIPHYLIVSDNNSVDGTREWLQEQKNLGVVDDILLNSDNYYPGKACNLGWDQGLKSYPQADFMMRVDNDMKFYKGWDKQAIKYYKAFPELGQLGLDYDAIDPKTPADLEAMNKGYVSYKSQGLRYNRWPGNVGGTHIMRREIWDMGLRYDERPWEHHGSDKPTPQEDSRLSFAILNKGYAFGHMMEKKCITMIKPEMMLKDKEYYRETMKQRGYQNVYKELYD